MKQKGKREKERKNKRCSMINQTCHVRTSVMTPMRSMSLAGERGVSLGVECPLGGEELAREEAVAEAVMEVPGWCTRARLRPSRLTLATRFSISSARSSVDSFSS